MRGLPDEPSLAHASRTASDRDELARRPRRASTHVESRCVEQGVERERHAADRAAALVQLAHVDGGDREAPRARAGGSTRTGTPAGITTTSPTTTELAAEGEGLVLVETSGSGTSAATVAPAGGVPGGRGDDRAALVERAEAEVEVVERGVDDPDRAPPGRRGCGTRTSCVARSVRGPAATSSESPTRKASPASKAPAPASATRLVRRPASPNHHSAASASTAPLGVAEAGRGRRGRRRPGRSSSRRPCPGASGSWAIRSTTAPAASRVAPRVSHWASARSGSTGESTSIHGLMA